MLNIATAQLATSVSAAGGIGFIAGGYETSGLEMQLRDAADLIKKLDTNNPARISYIETRTLPLGVGFLNWGADRESAMEILKRHPVAAVWLFAPREMPDLLAWINDIQSGKTGTEPNQARPQIWIQVGSVHEADMAISILQPDVLVIQGSDAGGHGLAQSASIITLLPEVHARLQSTSQKQIHLFAAGGITTGRSLLAAKALGASGAVMGTRFLAAREARVADGYRREILRASDGGVSTVRSTVYDRVRGIQGWPGKYNGRGIINESYVDAVERGVDDEENRRLYQAEIEKGDEGWGPNGRMTTYAGTGVGLVKEILSANEILEEVWAEARGVAGQLGL
jgi:nitronate monooxygenase